jgi:hypothetical protein
MYKLNYSPTNLGVQSWREIICAGTQTKKVEYQWLKPLASEKGCYNWASHAGLGCVCNNCISVYCWPLSDKKCGILLRVLLINLYLNDGILTCFSFVSIWNIALQWEYNIYIILFYSVLHFAILYYTKFVFMFVFQCHFMLCVILCVSNMTQLLCNHILLYDMFYILSRRATWWTYEMHVM